MFLFKKSVARILVTWTSHSILAVLPKELDKYELIKLGKPPRGILPAVVEMGPALSEVGAAAVLPAQQQFKQWKAESQPPNIAETARGSSEEAASLICFLLHSVGFRYWC